MAGCTPKYIYKKFIISNLGKTLEIIGKKFIGYSTEGLAKKRIKILKVGSKEGKVGSIISRLLELRLVP